MIIGLVGRTNVGKSTLFNRLAGTYRAIVTDISGTTRELLREEVNLRGKRVTLVDSPGLADFEEEKPFIEKIIEEADLLVFVLDGKSPLGDPEYQVKDLILKAGKKKRTCVVVNKLDGKVYGKDAASLIADFYTLGRSDLLPISAQQEEGVVELADMLDVLTEKNKIDMSSVQTEDDTDLHLAIVGRPNVGKSTLLNTLVGDQMAWVQDKPGTTLDYITAKFEYAGDIIKLYDTAGIRKKGRTLGLEKIAYKKTISMLTWIKPVTIMVIDLQEELTHRDKTLIAEIVEQGIPLVIALNKADMFEPHEADRLVEQIQTRVGFPWVPLIKISGKDGLGLPVLLKTVKKVANNYNHRVATGEVNDVLNKAWLQSPPRFPKNKICKYKYITQIETEPPVFMLSVNNAEYANFSFCRWVEKIIRKSFGFEGVPIELKFTSKVDKNPYLRARE